jgi:hypothetical protein
VTVRSCCFRAKPASANRAPAADELGLIDEFLELPHQKVETLTGQVGAGRMKMADFRHVPTHCKFIILMPQWHFLDFLARHARRYKTSTSAWKPRPQN